MIKSTKIELLRNLIAEGDISQAIKELQSITRGLPNLRNEVLLISSRYKKIKKDSHSGTVEIDTVNLETNRIVDSLLSIIDRLPQNEAVRTVWMLPIVATILMVLVLAFIVIPGTETPIRNHLSDTKNSVDTTGKIGTSKKGVKSSSAARNDVQLTKSGVKYDSTAHNDPQSTKKEEMEVLNERITESGQNGAIPLDTPSTFMEKIEKKDDSEIGTIKLYIDKEQEGEEVYINGKKIDGISMGVRKIINLPMHKEYLLKVGHCKEKKINLEKKTQIESYTCQN